MYSIGGVATRHGVRQRQVAQRLARSGSWNGLGTTQPRTRAHALEAYTLQLKCLRGCPLKVGIFSIPVLSIQASKYRLE